MNFRNSIILLTGLLISSICLYGQHQASGDTLNVAKKDKKSGKVKEFLVGDLPDSVLVDPFRDNHIVYTGQDLIDADFPKSWPLFGSRTRMSIGGYVKLDYIQDFNGMYDRFQTSIVSVPVEGDGRVPQSGYMNMFARETRFNFDIRSSTPKNNLPVRFFLEMDFWNLDRSAFFQSPRLRHAYVTIGNLSFGRTWGTLSDVYSIPVTLDFSGGDAVSVSRRPQVRYETPIGNQGGYKFAVGVEMLEYVEIDNNGFYGKPSMRFPVLAARFTKDLNGGGRIMLGASLYELRWDGQDSLPKLHKAAYGVLFSGRHYLAKQTNFVWNASVGNGWGSNIASQIGSGTGAIITPQEQLETIFSANIYAGFAIYFTPQIVTNINGGFFIMENNAYKSANALKSGATAHANLIISPYDHFSVGAEYSFGPRMNYNEAKGFAHRLQFILKYVI